MKKIKSTLIGLLLLIWLLFFILYPNVNKVIINQVLDLWLRYVIVSIIPAYIISNLLCEFPLISYLLYPVLKKIMHFENQKACSLFLLSLITGNPTSTILIISSYNKSQISLEEANRLIRFCSHISFLFILLLFDITYGLILFSIQVITSIIIANLSKQNNLKSLSSSTNSLSNVFLHIIDSLSLLLLKILIIMIIISLFKAPFVVLFNNQKWLVILFSFFEITIGMNDIIKNINSLPSLLFLANTLLSFNSLTIILQVFTVIKRTDLSFNQFLKYRFIHIIISNILLGLLFIFFY